MPYYSYAWANGLNVALASLSNVEDYLYPYTRPLRIAPKSQPVDFFPVEQETMDGSVGGGGFIDHEWQITLRDVAYDFILDDKFSGGTVKSVDQTIYTRLHDRRTYGRFNCTLVQPSVKKGTLVYVRQGVIRATFEFKALTQL